MQTIILGRGPMGRALADALLNAGHTVESLGRPVGARAPQAFEGADVVFDFSVGAAVPTNAEQAAAGGLRRLVIGATGWADARASVHELLLAHGVAAVAAANFSPGVALFSQLVGEATRRFAPLVGYEPFVVEWHRATKLDRPSGTARELVRRVLAAHPRKARVRDPHRDGPTPEDELEVVSVRAGASPGMHLVGFDAAGETLELRLTARDRSAYAAGAIAAAEWLVRSPRTPGVHSFDAVLDDLTQPLTAGSA
ncbi:MAG: dihydrodipicolinate reductase C-terminal domain-containing protein [Chloroflexota bacterium]